MMKPGKPGRNTAQILSILSLCVIFMLMGGCATTAPEKDAAEDTASVFESTSPKPAPAAYSGPKLPIAILPMGLSDRAAKRYPHLLDSSVGLGVHNVLTDALYRTRRFRLVEVNESIMKEVMKTQWLSASGAVDKGSAVEIGKMLGAQKVVYGEVYDYSEGKTEKIVGLKKNETPEIRVGVQIRLVDVETLEYIPASAVAYDLDWGRSSAKAIESAVSKFTFDF
jgi:curli biogenesis system outer membrane secretion channel CsgG